jgi:hypothetical protein
VHVGALGIWDGDAALPTVAIDVVEGLVVTEVADASGGLIVEAELDD